MNVEQFPVVLSEVSELSTSTRVFRFMRQDNKKLAYKPGQFYRFVFSDSEGEFERSYSLCNFHDLYGTVLELVISQVTGGRATQLLFSAETGIEARVSGPFGRLTLPEKMPRRLILVATSVGLAPYLPMLKQLEFKRDGQAGHDTEVVLLLGVRSRSEFIYGDTLLEYCSRHEFFDLRLSLSREPAKAAHEFEGYVTDQLKTLDVNPEQDHLMLCGNPAMVDDCYAYLKQLGCKPRQVIREKYVFAREAKSAVKPLSEEQKKLIAEKMKRHSK